MNTTTLHRLSPPFAAAALGLALLSSGPLSAWRPAPPSPHEGDVALTREQLRILAHMSLVELPDGQGGTTKTLRISGLNVQIVNGLEATNGNPLVPFATTAGQTAVNGLGNLILGYNEPGHPDGDERTGSHNLVLGQRNNYASFGGAVGGDRNAVDAPFARVVTGTLNRADGLGAAVVGGLGSLASGARAVTAGGAFAQALGPDAAVLGGSGNIAVEQYSTVVGGVANQAIGDTSCVVAGASNRAPGSLSTIVGGVFNVADGLNATLLGGKRNTASGESSCVSGGLERSVSGLHDWRAGELFQEE